MIHREVPRTVGQASPTPEGESFLPVMSWDFSLASPVTEILEKDSFTLKDLLDEDETPPECRNENEKLLE